MTKVVWRWAMVVAVVLGVAIAIAPHGVKAQAQAEAQPAPSQLAPAQQPQQVASVEQLKSQAFDALKSGRFEQTNTLLAKAASISPDPNLHQMADWVSQFESQRQQFTAERHKQYEKAVADVKKLLDNHKESYALDFAAKAGLLSDDKKAFRNEPWVDALVRQTIAMADQFDKS